MGKTVITLTIDERLSERAEEIAERSGVSVSQLFEEMLKHLDPVSSSPHLPSSSRQGAVPDDYEPSDWARRWRGAFAASESDTADENDSDVIVEEILRKHS